MPDRIGDMVVRDIRFPTSRSLDGSDAMNQAPDYSAVYVKLVTDTGAAGNGLAFTIGCGNEVCAAAVRALAPLIEGLDVRAGLAAVLMAASR